MYLRRAWRTLHVDPYVVVKLNGASLQIRQCQYLNGVPFRSFAVKREKLHFCVAKPLLLFLDILLHF
jgi:hypothetical protein